MTRTPDLKNKLIRAPARHKSVLDWSTCHVVGDEYAFARPANSAEGGERSRVAEHYSPNIP